MTIKIWKANSVGDCFGYPDLRMPAAHGVQAPTRYFYGIPASVGTCEQLVILGFFCSFVDKQTYALTNHPVL